MTDLSMGRHPSAQQIFLYESLARELTDAIQRGCFTAGTRMPSIRQLASQHKISMSTALQTYRILADKGLLVSRPGAGYYVGRKLDQTCSIPAVSQPPDQPARPYNLQLGLQFQQLVSRPGLISLGVTADPAPELIPSQAIPAAKVTACCSAIPTSK